MKLINRALLLNLVFTFFTCFLSLAQQPGTPDQSINYYSTFNASTSNTSVDTQGRIIVVGSFTKYKNQFKNYIVRIFPNGDLDESFNDGGTGPNGSVNQIKIQSDGKIIIFGNFTSYNNIQVNRMARLNADGSLDASFQTPANISPANVYYIKLAHFANENILLTSTLDTMGTILDKDGNFISNINPFPGGSIHKHIMAANILHPSEKLAFAIQYDIPLSTNSYTSYTKIIRLNQDGSFDNSFNFNITSVDRPISQLEGQPDGKILLAGNFQYINSMYKPTLIRLNSNGSIDPDFNNYVTGYTNYSYTPIKVMLTGNGKILLSIGWSNPCCPNNYNDQGYIFGLNEDGSKNSSFNSITAKYGRITDFSLSNDKLYINGDFKECAGATKSCFGICLPDGSNDDTFYAPAGVPHQYQNVQKLVTLPDGRMMASGFTTFGNKHTNLVRLNADGTFDRSFSMYVTPPSVSSFSSFEIQQDGKILIPSPLSRINSNGSVDNSFIPANEMKTNFFVQQMKIQPDGKILVAGPRGGNNTYVVMRLNSDGSLDNSFKIDSTSKGILGFAIQQDNKILVHGFFSKYGSINANFLVRLNSDGTVDGTFNSSTASTVRKVLILDNGQILAGGAAGILRLNSDGTGDPDFTLGSGDIFDIIKQTDNHFIVSGSFTSFQGTSLNKVAMIDSLGNIIYYSLNFPNTKTSYLTTLSKYDDNRFLIGGDFSNADSNLLGGFFRCYAGIPSKYKKIRGKIFTDANGNCQKEGAEKPIPGVIVKAAPMDYFSSTNSKGEYIFYLDSSVTNVRLSPILNPVQQFAFINQCAPYHDINLNTAKGDTCCFNFSDTIMNCSIPTIEITNSPRRRCTRGATSVIYSNKGNREAFNVKISVEFPEYIFPLMSNPQWTSRQGNVLYWDLPSLKGGNGGRIVIIDSVICGRPDIRNLTQCVKATITPRGTCIVESGTWDKSSIDVTGECTGGAATFTITNNGMGDMSANSEYRVFLNDTLVYSNSFKLVKGGNLKINVQSGGNTVRLEADQRPDHPGNSKPRLTIEACGGSLAAAVRDLVTSSAQDNEDFGKAISCSPIRDSFDPNDKMALPGGLTDAKFIRDSDKIDYTIRFQNTGSDYAYKVVIVDTLDQNLDISSFIAGAGSHDYKLEVSGIIRPVLRFIMDTIALPAKSLDSVNSSGAISFSIYPLPNLVDGTLIHNNAAIYFDYNSPVITNTVSHTIHDFQAMNLSKGNLVKLVTLPSLSTIPVSSVTANSAISGGAISDDGGTSITSKGICWSTAPDPTTLDNKTSEGTGTGSYTSALSGLSPNTTYYVRSYAINTEGTAYGNEVSFITSTTTGLNNNHFDSPILIYPNPNNGLFKIEFNSFDSSVLGLEISNAQGVSVFKEDINQSMADSAMEINMKNYSNGIYCLKLITDKGTVVKKLIINR